jgi:hypothetical protein
MKVSQVRTVVTARGLEVTATTPNRLGSSLFGLFFLLIYGGIFLFVAADILTGEAPAWREIIDALFGQLWLGLGFAALVLMVAFSGHANDHWIFGRRSLVRQHRLGRIVLGTDDSPLAGVRQVRVEERSNGGWGVLLDGPEKVKRGGGRSYRSRTIVSLPIEREEAEAAGARIRAWLAEPGSLPVESRERVPAPIAALEAGASLVTSRLTLAIPLVLGLSALVVLGFGWQHREATLERAAPLPRMDRTAEGELIDYHWFVETHGELGDRSSASARLVAAVRYHDDAGTARTLWLTTQRGLPLYEFGRWQLPATARIIGLPELEFALPEWMREVVARGDGWADWRAAARNEQPGAPPRDARAAGILAELDDPYRWLLARWSAPAEDWRVTYRSGAPEYAMPLRWAEAERAALATVTPRALLPLGAVACVVALLSLPSVIVRSRQRRWIGQVAVVLTVLAVPFWAPYTERVPGWLGLDRWLLDGAAFVLRAHASVETLDHVAIRRAWPPRDSTPTVRVRWTPERSDAFPLLRRLGLHEPPAGSTDGDTAAARAAMVDRAATALAALDGDALTEFLADYVVSGWERRAGALHESVVAPALCSAAPERVTC